MGSVDILTVSRPSRYNGYVANDPDQLLTVYEMARIFNVSERTIRRWSAIGELDDCLIRTPGGKFRYRLDAVRARINPPKDQP